MLSIRFQVIKGAMILLMLPLLAACAGIDDLSRESYRRGVLYTSDLNSETVVMLPMFARGENRSYLKPAESIFYKALTEMRQQMQLVSPQEGVAKMKDEEIYPFFETFQKEASFDEVAQEKDLAQFKKAFPTRFLLQTELQEVAVIEGATQVRIRGRVWDIEMGDVIWEGTGESRGYLFLFFPRTPATFEKAIETASRGLIRKLP